MTVLTSYLHPTPTRRDWETPPALFAAFDAEFRFTLDVCATAENAKCARFFTPADNGLAQDWGAHVCWMNPPYGRDIRAWMAKALDAALRGATVVALVPARTDSGWWHDIAMRGEVRFLRGRVRFVGAPWTAPFPSVVVVLRPIPPMELDVLTPRPQHAHAARLGHTPSAAEINADADTPTQAHYQQQFGGLQNAARRVGLVPNTPGSRPKRQS